MKTPFTLLQLASFLCAAIFFYIQPHTISAQQYSKSNGTGSAVFASSSIQKMQFIYTAVDLLNPPTGVIDKIYFRKNGTTNTVTLTNFQVKLGWTNQSGFPNSGTTFFSNLTPVLASSSYTITTSSATTAWFSIDVANNFAYATGQNLVVELSYTGSTSNSFGVIFGTGPSSPLHKRMSATTSTATTGSASTTWFDFGFDITGAPGSPSNDGCSTPIALTMNTFCNPVLGIGTGATQSLASANCGGAISSTAKDVWYSFVANGLDDSIFVQGLGGFDPVIQLYSGTCTSLSAIACSDDPVSGEAVEILAPGTLIPGTTYLMRVYGWNGFEGSFSICAKSNSVAAPVNDFCGTAVTLNPAVACNSIGGTNVAATQSLAPVNCGGATSPEALDVWYRFTAQSSGDSVIISTNSTLDPVVELFSGSCAGLTSLTCSDDPNISTATEKVATGTLTPGATYFVRVYGFGSSTGTFNICAKTPVQAASNDECGGSIPLSVNSSCSPSTYSNLLSTQSLTPVNCSPGGQSSAANDVWFSFVATSAGDSVKVFPVNGFDPVIQLFSGTCQSLVSLACSDQLSAAATETMAPGNLIPGQTYRVRVYGWAGAQGQFQICIKGASTIANNTCAGATVLSSPGLSCSPVAGSTLGASASGVAACSGIPDDDVWYRFTVGTSGNHVFRLTPLSGMDGVMQIFSGSCASLTTLACLNSGSTGVQEDTVLSLSAGTTIFIRVYHAGIGPGSAAFGLCINRMAAPAHDECTGAMQMTINSSSVCTPIYTTTYGATQSLAPILCNGFTSSSSNDVWIRFTATTPNIRVFVDNVGMTDPVVEAFTGTCGALTSIACKDDSGSRSGESLILTGLTVGSTIYVRFYSYPPKVYGDFNVCVQEFGGCLSQAGTTTVTPSATVSNGSIRGNLVGYSGTASWQYSTDGVGYTTLGVSSVPDTFYVGTTTNATYFIRAQVTTGNCAPAFSVPASFTAECATPLNNKGAFNSGTYITNFTYAGINNPSTTDPLKGSYQNFKNISGTVCKGISYPIQIGSSSSAGLYKAIWIDLNNDGDFADANENVLAPTLTSGSYFGNLTITDPNATGTVKMRIFIFNAGTTIPSSDPCFAGPYESGEIEEYTINILSPPTVSNAGNNFTSCNSTATLSGNSPTSGTGTWTLVSGSGTFVNPNSPNTDVTNLGLGANVFRWTIANACTSSVSTVTVTYTPGATANAGSDQTLCAEQTTLAGNAPGPNGTGTWSLFAGIGIISNPNAQNPVVSGLGNGLNRFIWAITVPGCGTTRDTVNIFRYQNPTTAQAGIDQQICGNQTTMAANPITVGTGTWSLISGTGTIANPTSPTSLVTNLGSGQNIFRWTATNGTCPSSTDEVVIVVQPITIANAGQDQTICSEQINLSGNTPQVGSGTWTVIGGSATVQNQSNPNSIATGLSPGQNVFVWTIPNGNCPVSKDTVVIIRVQSQTAFAGQDQSICGGQATLAATAAGSGTGTWTLVSGSGQIADPFNPNTMVTGLGTGNNTFRWTITNAPCPLVSDEVVINNLGNVTIAQAGQDQTICNTQATLAGNTAIIGIGQWTLISGSGQISAPTNPTSTITNLGVGLNVFRWTIINGNCPPSFDDVVITRVAAPSVAAAGPDQNICTNSTTLAANTPSIGTGIWTLVSGSGQILDPTNPASGVNGLSTGTNTFRWTIVNSPCASSSDEVSIITTSNSVTAQAGADQIVCASNATLSANNAGSGTGLWTVVSGSGTVDSPNLPTSTISNLGIGNNIFRWTITTGSCPPSTDEVQISRKAETTQANAGPDQNLCTSSAILAGNVPQNGTGMWTIVSGTGTISDPTQANTTVNGLGNGQNVFRWTINNLPCASSADEVTINTTLSATTANAGTDQTVCGTNAQLIGNAPGTGTGQWTLVSGAGNITNPGGNSTSVTNLGPGINIFRWTITTGTCSPSIDEVQINSVSNPVAANAGNDQNICGSSATLSANVPSQGTGTWTLVSGSGQIANPGSPSTTVVSLGSGANIFRWTISNPPCAPTFDDVVITATPANVTSQAGPDQMICGSSVFLNATAPVSGFGVWSLVSGSGIVAQPGNPVSEVTNLGPGQNTFAWTVTSGSCTASDLVVITKEIKTLYLGKDTIMCNGNQLVLNAGPGFTTYQWFDNSIAQTLTVGSSGSYWVQVTTAANCPFRDTIEVTFVPCTNVEPEKRSKEKLTVYPNPSDGRFTLEMETNASGLSRIRVFNNLGIEIWEEEKMAIGNKISTEIHLKGVPAGMYFVELENEKGRQIRKLILR